MPQQRSAGPGAGFQGSIDSMPLVDLLQVWALNRFSGLVAITSQGRTGKLYLAEGEVVHAEADGHAGEAAVRAVIGWPQGAFELVPNTSTLKRTIHKSVSHLLLDAHRGLDEQRHAAAAPTPPPAAPQPREPARPGVLEQIRAIHGVTRVVRFGQDGRPADEGHEAEALAARGLYLAMTQATWVASAFGLHDLGIASLRGQKESFVLVHGSGRYLCVSVAAGMALDPVVSQLRAILSRPTPR